MHTLVSYKIKWYYLKGFFQPGDSKLLNRVRSYDKRF